MSHINGTYGHPIPVTHTLSCGQDLKRGYLDKATDSDGCARNTASWSFETFTNLLFRIIDSERVSNCQSRMFSVNETLLRRLLFRTIFNSSPPNHC